MKRMIILAAVVLVAVFAAFFYTKNRAQQNNEQPPATEQVATTEDESKQTKKDDTKYLIIKEWGVRIKLPKQIEGATYDYTGHEAGANNRTTWVGLRHESTSEIKGCKDETVFAIARAEKKTDSILDSGYTVQEIIDDGRESSLTKIKGFYFNGSTGNGPCFDVNDDSAALKFQEIESNFIDAYDTLESVN